MKKFQNKKKDKFLSTRPTCSIETSNIAEKSKFNFAYFDSNQTAGQDFLEWEGTSGITTLINLMNKIKDYTDQPLKYWNNQRVGGGGLKVLEYYEEFPKKSDFIHPKHIPHDVVWSRFRLGNKVRLVGFVISEHFHGVEYKDSKGESYFYDLNTFYVVFLDKDHRFYITETS